MNRKMPILTAIILATAATACAPPPNKARYTVEEYLADDSLRMKQMAKCRNDPGSIGMTPDCINAGTADAKDGRGRFKDRLQPKF